jgi:hypothetical protein
MAAGEHPAKHIPRRKSENISNFRHLDKGHVPPEFCASQYNLTIPSAFPSDSRKDYRGAT